MPSWNDLLNDFNNQSDNDAKAAWLTTKQKDALDAISRQRGNRNVLFYASSFLQKPQAPGPSLQITHEDVNGFMSTIYGMTWDQGLTLLLHTPGGVTNAAETIVAYLWSKFDDIEVIIPTYAMSAGTMISLAANRLIMGRQSQLGPIDPQMPIVNRFVSARAIVDQFDEAKKDILANRDTAHVWAPILQSLGPALLQEAKNALDYGQEMVERWLAQRMFASRTDAAVQAKTTAAYFNVSTQHKSHGRRIDRDEARTQKVVIDDLEDDQILQDHVLTAYHAATIAFEKGPATKTISSHHGRFWIKNWPAK